jgi:hypothetical protein
MPEEAKRKGGRGEEKKDEQGGEGRGEEVLPPSASCPYFDHPQI